MRVKGDAKLHPLDHRGFQDIRFRGEYPLATVEYRDAALPLTATLEAFSPFIPLNAEASSLPVTVMRFTVRNTSRQAITAELVGWMANAVCLYSKVGTKQTGDVRNTHLVGIEHAVTGADEKLPDFGTLALALTEPQSIDFKKMKPRRAQRTRRKAGAQMPEQRVFLSPSSCASCSSWCNSFS